MPKPPVTRSSLVGVAPYEEEPTRRARWARMPCSRDVSRCSRLSLPSILAPDALQQDDVRLAAAGPSRTTPRERRTLHFTSSGGTRIVWTINPQLQL